MIEYVEKELLLQKAHGVSWIDGVGRAAVLYDDIKSAPAADVIPVVHGRWEYEGPTINSYSRTFCSECGWWTIDPSVSTVYSYCPSCGAKMYGGNEDG